MQHDQFREICDNLLIERDQVQGEFDSRHVYINRSGIRGNIREECERVAGEFIGKLYGSDTSLLLPTMLIRLEGHVQNLLETYKEGHSIWNGIHDIRIAIAIVAAEAFSMTEQDIDVSPASLSQLRNPLPGTDKNYDIRLASLLYQSDQLALTIARECCIEVSLLD